MDRVDLRPEHIRFLTELMRDQRRTRSAGSTAGSSAGTNNYGREQWTTDPSIDAIVGPYAAVLNHYVLADSAYANDLNYEVLTDRVHPSWYKESRAQHLYVLDIAGRRRSG